MVKSMKKSMSFSKSTGASDTTGVPSWASKVNAQTLAEIKKPALGEKRRELEAAKLKESMKKFKKAYSADQEAMGNIVKFQKDKK